MRPAAFVTLFLALFLAPLFGAGARAATPQRVDAVGTWMPEALDLDGDVHPDRLVIRTEAGSLVLGFVSSRSGAREIGRVALRPGEALPGVQAIDLDGDGDLDIAVCEPGHGTIHRFLNDGAGNFTPMPAIAAPGTVAPMLPFPAPVALAWWPREEALRLAPPTNACGALPVPARAPRRGPDAPALPRAPLGLAAVPPRAPPPSA